LRGGSFLPWVLKLAIERLIPLSVKLITNELDVEGSCLTPYLAQGRDAFQMSGIQSK